MNETVTIAVTYGTRSVGQNHKYKVYVRYFWLKNHQIYGVYIRIFTVLANPSHTSWRILSIGRTFEVVFAPVVYCLPSPAPGFTPCVY